MEPWTTNGRQRSYSAAPAGPDPSSQGNSPNGACVRTASRHGADVPFDWDNPATHGPALAGVDSIYLVTPVMRVAYAHLLSDFLDSAEASGVRHVTYLSTYGSDQAPPEVDIRAVERELMRRAAFTSSVLRPAWVMQNFSDEHLPVVQDMITVPTAGGAERLFTPPTSPRSPSRCWSTPLPTLALRIRPPVPKRSRWPRSPTSSRASSADRSGTTTSSAAFGLMAPSRPGSCPPTTASCSAG